MIKTRLIRLLADAQKYIYLQVLFDCLALFCQTAIIFSAVTIIEKLYTNTAEIQNYIICGAVVVCALIIRYILDKLSAKMSFLASANVKKVFREKIYNKLLQLGTSYKEKVSTSSVVQMAAEGVDQLETYFGNYLPQLIYSLLAPVTLFILLSFVNLKAAVILLVCVPLIPVSIVLVQKIAKGLLSKYWGSYTELGDSFLEKLQGLTTLKIYSADDRAADELDKESEHFRKITMKVLTMQLNSTSVMDIMAYGGAAIGIMFALLEFANGNTGLGGTLLIILLASEFFIPLRKLGSFFHIAMNGMAASDKIFALLDTEQPQNAGKKINGTVESITVSNLNYAYTADRKILNNINMEVGGKGLVSIVGTSGSGKSTLAAILMGRNKNYAGSIQINGTELSEIDERELMNRITFVSGDSHIFKGTIRDNLLLGDRNATDSQMYNALSVAKLDDFVKKCGGLDMKISENGSSLSGGQRQRLALARAVLHNSQVYIFDEATGNIDMESEEMIIDAIKELSKTKAVIQISHRLANVIDSDIIYMLSGGTVAEKGTHKQLMEHGEKYSELFNYQSELEGYKTGEGTNE